LFSALPIILQSLLEEEKSSFYLRKNNQMVKIKKCLDCKAEFEVKPRARFVRKYCDSCSAKRKKRWDEQWKVKFEDFDDDDE